MKEIEGPPADYRLPKSVMRWVAVGVTLSSAIVIVITVFSGVTWSDLEQLGYLPFGLAAAASVARLFVQVLRFRVIAVGLADDPKPDLGGVAIARMSSEFIAMSTPSEVGGPVLRAAWLSGKGVEAGKSLWIGYFEVLIEIYVGSGLGLIAAAIALSRGAVVVGSAIAAIATILIVGYTLIIVVPALRSVKVPRHVFSIASLLLGAPRATALYLRAVVGSLNFSVAARAIMNRRTLPVVVKAVGLTILEDVLEGTALWLVLNAAGLKIDIFSATFTAFGVLTIAAIPVSIGGSGLTEVSTQLYLSSVYGFSSWAAIVLWRIASFQVVLAVSGFAFLLFTRRATGSDRARLAGGEGPGKGASIGNAPDPANGHARPSVEISSC
ncbi:MAG TPA: lysylphosphatidylglycerol synthase transmembrane domain-containing protein [Nitrososphaerales archaeon]|nr:lysylphosphatidylglycerol synthase transmembrane domain-containing protein [Nitrososphaerales archaeon]